METASLLVGIADRKERAESSKHEEVRVRKNLAM